MATFVLVHGGWHGGWCWRDVRTILQKAGHQVFTPTLTGLGERSHLASFPITMQTHVTDIVNVLEYEELHDVILVGHSYGGSVIPGVANTVPERIAHLVCLDSQTPAHGDRYRDIMKPDFYDIVMIKAENRGDGLFDLGPRGAQNLGIVDERIAAWVNNHLTAHPVSVLDDPIQYDNPAALAIPRTYVDLSDRRDKAEMEEKGWRYIRLPKGHMAVVTAPDEVTRVLLMMADS